MAGAGARAPAAGDRAATASTTLLDREPAEGAVRLALEEARGGASIPVYKSLMSLVRSPRVRVFDDAAPRRGCVAERIVGAVEANPSIVLGLPTGRTPIALYDELVQLSAARGSRLVVRDHLQPRRVHRAAAGPSRRLPAVHAAAPVQPGQPVARRASTFSTAWRDPAGECARYEAAIVAADGIDIQVLGIGTNGHIGFNEPGRELQSRTHRVTLQARDAAQQRDAVRRGYGRGCRLEALSMGMATILQARSVILLANGHTKAHLRRARRQRSADDGSAGVVPAAAPRRRHHPGCGRREASWRQRAGR